MFNWIPNADEWHKFWSVRAMALAGFLATAQTFVDQFNVPALVGLVESPYYKGAMAVIAFGSILLRVLTQPKLTDPTKSLDPISKVEPMA